MIFGKFGRFVATGITVLLISFSVSVSFVCAEPMQVTLMPGFPLMAGKVVMVMWTPVPNAVKYAIYLDDKKIADAVMPPFQFDAPQEAKEYSVSVAAVDSGGAEGAKSRPGKFGILSLDPPKSLDVLRKGDKGETVAIRWAAPKGANIFNVYRKDGADQRFKLLTSTQDVTYSDSTVELGKTYEYAVSAKDITGKESALSPSTKVVLSTRVEERKEKVVAKAVKTTYEIISPVGVNVLSPTEIRFKGGFLYVLDTGMQALQKFDLDGKYVSSIGKGGYLPGQFLAPNAFVFLPGGGYGFLDGTRKKIILLKEDGELIAEFPIPRETKNPNRKFSYTNDPIHMAVTKDGNLAVIDGSYRRVVIMSLKGDFITDFMEEEKDGRSGVEMVRSPSSIAVDPDGNLYVADGSMARIHVFGPDYKPKYKIDYPTGPGSFVAPGKFDFHQKTGALLVPDGMLATIQGFSMKDGKYQYTLTGETGKLEKEQLPIWELGSTRALSVAPDGSLWVLMALDKKFVHVTF